MFSTVTYFLQEKHIKNLTELKQILQSGGAKKEFYLSSLVQFVICDDEDVAKKLEDDVKEANPDALIIKSDWIMLSAKCGLLLPPDLFCHAGEKVFTGLTFCPSGLSHSDCAKLWTMVVHNGGKWQKKLDNSVTHLVTCKTTGTRYQCAMEHGVNLVSPDWVLDCIEQDVKLSEMSYHPSLLESAEPSPAREVQNGPSSLGNHVGHSSPDGSMPVPLEASKMEASIACPTITIEAIGSTATAVSSHRSTDSSESMGSFSKSIESQSGLSNQAETTSHILQGIVFSIVDYPKCVGEEAIEKWKKVIHNHGGILIDKYDSVLCTHMIAQRTNSDICRKALADGKCISSAYWLNSVLTTGMMCAPSNALHFPTACNGRADNPNNYSITLTNYVGNERRLVKDMIRSTGLPYTGYLSKQTTHLICKCEGGKKFEKAKEWGLKIVNSTFISDVIFTGKLPELSSKHFILNQEDEFLPLSHPSALSILEPWKVFLDEYSIGKKTPHKRKRNSDMEKYMFVEKNVFTKKSRVTDSEGDDGEVRVQSGTTMAPSLTKEPRIVFTGVSGAAMTKMKEIINRLGGVEVDAKDCTHLVTSRLTRTIKFLCAISVARHMVTTGWIVRSGDVGYFVDETEFALKDQYAETIYGFNIPASLRKAQSEKLLQGLTFYCTPQVIPCPESLREIIKCAGGEVVSLHTLQTMDASCKKLKHGLTLYKKPLVVLTCDGDLDSDEVSVFDEAGIAIYNTEFVMMGVLRQKLEYNLNKMKPPGKKKS